MKNIRNRMKGWILSFPKSSVGIAALIFLMISLGVSLFEVVSRFKHYGILPTIIALISLFTAAFVVACFAVLLRYFIGKIRREILFVICLGIVITIISLEFFPYGFVIGLSCTIFIYLVLEMIQKKYKESSRSKRVLCNLLTVFSGVIFVSTVIFVLQPGASIKNKPDTARLALTGYKAPKSELSDPSKDGEYTYKEYLYASVGQKINPYPGETVLESRTADASFMLAGWTRLRTCALNITPETLPLNARVWMPDGEGDFPLVLIVHGNHESGERSDEGYEYIAKMLVTQGYIVLSVDENFLNGSAMYDYLYLSALKNENGARAYILLEHLKQLYDWNLEEGNVFYNKIDFERIALIGHSRGGEAAAIAAMLAQKEVYPDNAMIRLDYPFLINTVIAIAPVHGQFEPADTELSLEGTNYLVMHGAQDMDVTHFSGANTYHRVSTEGIDTLGNRAVKAKVHIQNANHGQFNDTWGRVDIGGLSHLVFNRNMYMEKQAQQQAAKVLIGAFLRGTIGGETKYFELFSEFCGADEWLPPTTYTTDFMSSEKIITTFDEDINLTNTRIEGIDFSAKGFDKWTQKPLSGGNSNRVLSLKWNNINAEPEAIFTIRFDKEQVKVTKDNVLEASICAEDSKMDLECVVRATDINGNRQELSIDLFGGIPGAVHAPIYKMPISRFLDKDEPVLQKISIPFERFDKLEERIVSLEFVFPADENGSEMSFLMDDLRMKGEVDF